MFITLPTGDRINPAHVETIEQHQPTRSAPDTPKTVLGLVSGNFIVVDLSVEGVEALLDPGAKIKPTPQVFMDPPKDATQFLEAVRDSKRRGRFGVL